MQFIFFYVKYLIIYIHIIFYTLKTLYFQYEKLDLIYTEVFHVQKYYIITINLIFLIFSFYFLQKSMSLVSSPSHLGG